MKYRGFLIDMDGVVFQNSIEVGVQLIHSYLNERTPIAYETVLSYVRLGNSNAPEDLFTNMFSALGITDSLNDFFVRLGAFEGSSSAGIEMDSQFRPFVEKCLRAGTEYYIFSLASAQRIAAAIPFIGPDRIMPVDGAKSDVGTFHRLSAKLPSGMASWCLIDDDPFALRSAKLAGMDTCMMLNKVFGERQYREYAGFIDMKVRSFGELLEVVDG